MSVGKIGAKVSTPRKRSLAANRKNTEVVNTVNVRLSRLVSWITSIELLRLGLEYFSFVIFWAMIRHPSSTRGNNVDDI